MASLGYGQDKIDQNLKLKQTQQRIQESKKILVILPPMTPFDLDPKTKAVYLEQYQVAYRNIVADLGLELDSSRFDFKKGVKESVFKAYIQGWSDGIRKAQQDHPEKVKIIHIYKTIYGKPGYSDTGLYIDSSKAGLNIK